MSETETLQTLVTRHAALVDVLSEIRLSLYGWALRIERSHPIAASEMRQVERAITDALKETP